jgi:hypothetical protein
MPTSGSPTTTAPRRSPAAALLEQSLGGFRGDLTVADAAARGGLALRDAEDGLRRLASGRGGHLKATEQGELIYSFPDGLVEPPEARRATRLARAVARGLLSAGRFVVRAWVSIVMVAYAVLFLVVMIALAARDDDRDGIGDGLAMVGRVLMEALFWTFHPFSPLQATFEPGWLRSGRRRPRGLPFYERVNRFVFGPPPAVEDPRERERTLLGEIRRLEGRVGPGDVMRVTGLDRAGAERELLRLVVDYDGDIQVSEGGAILYVFKALRTTAVAGVGAVAAAPVWNQRVALRPLTGNSAGTNVFLTALNGFNMVAGAVGVSAGLTIERLTALLTRTHADAMMGVPLPPVDGAPLLLGWIPLVFSAAMFVLPVTRALRRRREAARVAAENGRRALLRLVAAEPDARVELTAEEARRAWISAANGAAREPRPAELEAAVRALGGEIDITDDGVVVYRFATAARERRALQEARAAAPRDEARPGQVIFSSAAPGAGGVDDA